MGEAHSGGVFLDVLAARTARPKNIDLHVVWADLDFASRIHFGEHLDLCETGLPRAGGVERRLPHEAVDAAFALQVAESIRPVDFDGGAFDPGLFALSDIEHVCRKTAALGPAQVHAKEHLRPVLRVCATGAGVDGEDRVAAVVRAGKLKLKLQVAKRLFDGGQVFVRARADAVVAFAHRHRKQFGNVTHLVFEATPGLDPRSQCGEFLHNRPRAFAIVPEGGFSGELFEFGYARFVVREVKVAPGCQRCVRPVLSRGLAVRTCW